MEPRYTEFKIAVRYIERLKPTLDTRRRHGLALTHSLRNPEGIAVWTTTHFLATASNLPAWTEARHFEAWEAAERPGAKRYSR